MGKTYVKHGGGTSTNFWPDDDENTIYLAGDYSLELILAEIKDKWPGYKIEDITISSEWIQTECLTYDLYCPGDYTQFLVITKNG